MVGKKTTLGKPVNLQLYGKPLPWVTHATHLGHEFHEDGTMSMDARIKRGSYIGKSLEVMDSFNFAAPSEVLGAIKLFASDLYGGMLWRLNSLEAEEVGCCWNTMVKDVWGLSRATHTYIVRWLSGPHSSLMEDLLARWVKYYQSCLSSPSPEVSIVARIAAGDIRTTTGANNRIITELGLDPRTASPAEVRLKYRESLPKETEEQMAKLGLLLELLERRGMEHTMGKEQDGEVNDLIDFICTQ